jgi:thiol-disulfide isomerase/thioredoxin
MIRLTRCSFHVWALGILAISLALGCQSDPGTNSARAAQSVQASPLKLPDVSGNQIAPLQVSDGDYANVLIFVAAECPICNAYAGEINRMSQAYAAKGIHFYLIDVDANLPAADVARHAHDFALAPPVLLDPKHLLVDKFAATTTPEVLVIGRDNDVFYRGRIDDVYIALGQRRFEAREHDLRDALDALIAGKPAPMARTTPIGCAI